MKNKRNFYDKFWTVERGDFNNYIRNSNLPDLFYEGDLILDVGCGDGTVGEFLQRNRGVKVKGIDISDEAIKKALEKGLDAKVWSSEKKFPFESDLFDKVFWGDNIEHLFEPAATLKEIKRVLKINGKLILSCPNMGYWRYRVYYLLHGRLPDTEWTGLKPWEWSHIRFFNLKILQEFLLSCGFNKITKVIGISERRLDKPFLDLNPALFGMILLIEAI